MRFLLVLIMCSYQLLKMKQLFLQEQLEENFKEKLLKKCCEVDNNNGQFFQLYYIYNYFLIVLFYQYNNDKNLQFQKFLYYFG